MAKPAILTSDELEQDQVHVVDIPHEWKSPKSLFNFITVEAPHKSRNKFEVIIDVLRHHAVMSAHKDDLIQLLTLIVSRASQKILKSQTSTKAKSNVEGSGHGREHLLKRRRRENTKPVDNKHADEGIFSTPKTSPRVSTIPDELCTYDTTEEELLLMPIPMDLDDGIVPPIVDMNKMKKMSQKLKFCNGLFIPIEEPPQDHGGIPSCLCDWDFILDDDSCNFALIESANPEADLSDAMSCAHRSWKPFPEEPHRVYLERRSFALQ